MNNITTGEIFMIAIPDIRKKEIIETEQHHFHVPNDLMQDSVYRIECVNQPVIRHRNLGNRGGFARQLCFKALNLSVDLYNELYRWMNNRRLLFVVRDHLGQMQVLFSPLYRTKIEIRGETPDRHIVRASTQAGPNHVPISLLVHADGRPMTQGELEQYLMK